MPATAPARAASRTASSSSDARGAFSRFASRLAGHSNFLRGLEYWTRGDRSRAEVATAADQPRVPEADRKELLASFLALCRERGIELVVMIPQYREFEDHIPLLRTFVLENGVAAVDVPRHYQDVGLDWRRRSLFNDEVHPNERGHELVADAAMPVLAGLR